MSEIFIRLSSGRSVTQFTHSVMRIFFAATKSICHSPGGVTPPSNLSQVLLVAANKTLLEALWVLDDKAMMDYMTSRLNDSYSC
jgi:hypothetical protein